MEQTLQQSMESELLEATNSILETYRLLAKGLGLALSSNSIDIEKQQDNLRGMIQVCSDAEIKLAEMKTLIAKDRTNAQG